MHRPILLTILTVSLTINPFSPPAMAEEFCVTTSAQLQAAFVLAAVNGEADTIRVAAGSYEVPASGGFVYDSTSAVGGDDEDISIIGGWIPFPGSPCGQLGSTDPFNTTLDGDNRFRVLFVRTRFLGNITVKNLAFINGFAPGVGNGGGGLLVTGSTSFVGDVLVENTAMLGNLSHEGGGLQVDQGNTVRVINNLVVANRSVVRGAGIRLQNSNANGIYLINNTVLNNATDSPSSLVTGGTLVTANGSSQAFIANNILWGNTGRDLELSGFGDKHLFNNNIEDRFGEAISEAGNLSLDPQLSNEWLNFSLTSTSPLVDAGRNPPTFAPFPTPFEFLWNLPEFDLSDNPRIQGLSVDIGALETPSDILFTDGFE